MSRKNTTVIVAIPTPLISEGKRERNYVIVTFQHWTKLGDKSHATRAKVLTHSDFLEENRDTTEQHGDEVHNEKSTCIGE